MLVVCAECPVLKESSIRAEEQYLIMVPRRECNSTVIQFLDVIDVCPIVLVVLSGCRPIEPARHVPTLLYDIAGGVHDGDPFLGEIGK